MHAPERLEWLFPRPLSLQQHNNLLHGRAVQVGKVEVEVFCDALGNNSLACSTDKPDKPAIMRKVYQGRGEGQGGDVGGNSTTAHNNTTQRSTTQTRQSLCCTKKSQAAIVCVAIKGAVCQCLQQKAFILNLFASASSQGPDLCHLAGEHKPCVQDRRQIMSVQPSQKRQGGGGVLHRRNKGRPMESDSVLVKTENNNDNKPNKPV